MSVTRYARDGLTVVTYAGPAAHSSPNTNSRTMVQIAARGLYVDLTMDYWVDLACFIRDLDFRGLGITNAPEVPDE